MRQRFTLSKLSADNIHSVFQEWKHRKKCLLLIVLFSVCSALSYSQKVISGTVKDASGNALQGVTVQVKDDVTGANTDATGHYALTIPAGKTTLIFSFVGYATQQIPIGTRSSIDLSLEESISPLSEVVVTGYSSQSRTTLSTAITKLDNRILENIPYANVATAMQGTLAGVRVQTIGGQPGAAPRVIVRGGTSINNPNGAAPLYIIDGVIRDISDISPDDIESLQVLKDAASTAIYGARGSNGVVLITTRSGKPGKTQITYKYDITSSEVNHLYDFPSAREYLQTARIGIFNAATYVPARLPLLVSAGSWGTGNDLTQNTLWTTQFLTPANQFKLNEGWESMPDPLDPTKTIIFKDTDFQSLLYRRGLSHNHYISVSGGTDKATFNASMGYMNQEGVIKTSDYQRLTLNLNGTIQANEKLSFFGRVGYQKSSDDHIDAIGYAGLMRATALPSVAKYAFENGTIAQGLSSTLGNPDYYLPLFDNKKFKELETNRLTFSLGSHWKIFPGLSFDPLVSLYHEQAVKNNFSPEYRSGLGLPVSTRIASASYGSNRQYQADMLFNYSKSFSGVHNLTAVAGFVYVGNRKYGLSANGRGAATDNIPTLNASPTPVSVGSTFSEQLILSYLASVHYNYKQKYLLALKGRYDGGSNLGNAHKWGFFPGISAAWNVHKEKFWRGNIPDKVTLKLRTSYGVNGNISGLGDYTAQGTYASNAIYGTASAIQNTVLPNGELRWEESKTLDFGTELGLFRNRVNIIFDVYRRVTENLITTLTLPPSTGFGNILTNYGSYENKGVELELNANVMAPGLPFQWQVSFNMAKVKSTILQLPYSGTDKNRVGGEFLWDANSKTYTWQGGLQEGGRVGDMFAYKQLGVYATDAEAAKAPADAINAFPKKGGDVIWQDTDGNGTIDARDRVYVGNTYPDFTGGFSNYFSYKNIALSARMDYTTGHTINNALLLAFDQNSAGDINMTQRVVDRGWKKQGDVTDVPQYLWLDPKQNLSRGNDTYYVSGDYLALREVTLSYTLPRRILQKLKFSTLRINFTGNNLHYFTKFTEGINAEDGGSDGGRYPLSKNYTFGINLTF